LVASPFCLACDKSGVNAQGADKADAAQSDFEKARDDYRRQKEADLAVLDKSIRDLEAKESASAVEVKTDLRATVSSLKAAA
jgi:hypothetical protein